MPPEDTTGFKRPRATAELVAAVEAMPADTPAGPWYYMASGGGVGPVRPCGVCGVDIDKNHARNYYRLVADAPAWEGAVMHGQCGRLARIRRFPKMDLVHNA